MQEIISDKVINGYKVYLSREVVENNTLGAFFSKIMDSDQVDNNFTVHVELQKTDLLHGVHHDEEIVMHESVQCSKKEDPNSVGDFFLDAIKKGISKAMRAGDNKKTLSDLTNIRYSYSGNRLWDAIDLSDKVKMTSNLKRYLTLLGRKKNAFDTITGLDVSQEFLHEALETENKEDIAIFKSSRNLNEEELKFIEQLEILAEERVKPRVIKFKDDSILAELYFDHNGKLYKPASDTWVFSFEVNEKSMDLAEGVTAKLKEYNQSIEIMNTYLQKFSDNEEYEKCIAIKERINALQ